MKITQRAEYVWSEKQQRHIPLRRLSINWTGPVALCKGATAQQSQLADSQQAFYNTMTQDYNQQFQSQNAILGTLSNTLNPIIAAGPNQYGFSTAETNNLNSQAVQSTGQQYNNAEKALASQQASAGGGNTLLPSGAAQAQQAGLAASAANQSSNQLLGIQQAGYQQGAQQYQSAIGQLGGVAGMYNANGVAGAANSSGGTADSQANAVQSANQQVWNNLSGILAGGLGAAGSIIGGGLAGRS